MNPNHSVTPIHWKQTRNILLALTLIPVALTVVAILILPEFHFTMITAPLLPLLCILAIVLQFRDKNSLHLFTCIFFGAFALQIVGGLLFCLLYPDFLNGILFLPFYLFISLMPGGGLISTIIDDIFHGEALSLYFFAELLFVLSSLSAGLITLYGAKKFRR